MRDLLERVKAATEPDSALDIDIAVTLGNWCLHPKDRQRDDSYQSDRGWTCLDCGADSWGNTGQSGQKRSAKAPAFTASLDAVLSLAERTLPGCRIGLVQQPDGSWGAMMFLPVCVDEHYAPKAPLAALAALLTAKIEEGAGE